MLIAENFPRGSTPAPKHVFFSSSVKKEKYFFATENNFMSSARQVLDKIFFEEQQK
jgi:hypothetical protein